MSKQIVTLQKTNPATSYWAPFEAGMITTADSGAASVTITDALRRKYFTGRIKQGEALTFTARGAVGRHEIEVFDQAGLRIASLHFTLRTETRISCNGGPYGQMAERIRQLLERNDNYKSWLINGKLYRMLVCWGRDHVHTLKAWKYFLDDVKSGMEYWLETQEESGMLWDCIYQNSNYPAPTWLGEALGEGWYRYDEGMKYIVRRIPVEADCEFLYAEGVWYAWKASGDDAWMAKQLPILERALKYNNSHPDRWSPKHGLVRRSFCMDSWDFANAYYCNGDYRCINPGDPQFLFHSDNSGLYAFYWRMAEMYEALGNHERAGELRREGEELRERANRKLFFETNYGHMIPEDLPEDEVYAKVGDERKRMSLSTGYTINRGLPTHEMAVAILREYRRRLEEKRHESFAEWWTMDPPYTKEQWPGHGPEWGEYMNGAICSIIAGEIAKAAFDHGLEDYGVDILERVWALSERDGGELHQIYRRLPENPEFTPPVCTPVDIHAVVNRGLKNGAHNEVEAWTGEGDNDMRNLPTGRQTFGPITFDIIDPATNGGKAVLRLSSSGVKAPKTMTIPVPKLRGNSLYFLHAAVWEFPQGKVAGLYVVCYEDGNEETVYIREGREINNWWGPSDTGNSWESRGVSRAVARVAWWGPNPEWKNVGIYMYGWNNPHPDRPITAIRVTAANSIPSEAGVILAGITISDQKVRFEESIRSDGLPDCWSQAAVYYALAEGLAGIEDRGRSFDQVGIAPRWVVSRADEAEVVLHYPSSDGYCAYRYRHDAVAREVTLDLTGSFEQAEIHCLLPAGSKAERVMVEGKEVVFRNTRIESSHYVDFKLDELPQGPVVVAYGV